VGRRGAAEVREGGTEGNAEWIVKTARGNVAINWVRRSGAGGGGKMGTLLRRRNDLSTEARGRRSRPTHAIDEKRGEMGLTSDSERGVATEEEGVAEFANRAVPSDVNKVNIFKNGRRGYTKRREKYGCQLGKAYIQREGSGWTSRWGFQSANTEGTIVLTGKIQHLIIEENPLEKGTRGDRN